jgi:hypothetical protein
MSDERQPEEIRQALLAAARERLRAHLAGEEAALAAAGPDQTPAAAVRRLLEQLGAPDR